MTYDFSTAELRKAFVQKLHDANTWHEPLPNLEWITHTEFVKSNFFLFAGGEMFTRSFGGPNAKDNLGQFPEGWNQNPQWKQYTRCFIRDNMQGWLLLPNTSYQEVRPYESVYNGWKGKLYVAKFAFCTHSNSESKNLGRCYNRYTCLDCGYSHAVDSSD
jgi:hypothetical protein